MNLLISIRDHALLGRQFLIDDPRSLENLTPIVPDRKDIPAVEYRYDLTPPKDILDRKPNVWCAHCQKINHWKGYVMLQEDGTRFLCGHDCGKKIYGADFIRIQARFKAAERRQDSLSRLHRAMREFPLLINGVREISRDPAFRALHQLQLEFENGMSLLYDSLKLVAKRQDARLSVIASFRDYKAEDERKERNVQRITERRRRGLSSADVKELKRLGKIDVLEDESEQILKDEEIWLGLMVGTGFITNNFLRRADIIKDFADDLFRIYTRFANRDTDEITDRDIVKGMNELQAKLGQIKRDIRQLGTVRDFFAPDHLRLIATWGTQTYECGGDYREDAGALRFSPRGGDSDDASISLPANLKLPTLDLIHRFERSVAANSTNSLISVTSIDSSTEILKQADGR